MPAEFEECVAVSLPNLRASSGYGFEFVHIERRQRWKRCARSASGGDNLDVVRAFLYELGGVSARASFAPVTSPPKYPMCPPMMETGRPHSAIARANRKPLIDSVAQPEHRNILGPVLAYRGNAGEQAYARVPRRLHGKHFVGQQREVVAQPPVAEAVMVRMAIHHPRHNSAARIVQCLRRSPLRHANLTRTPYGGDSRAFKQNRAVFDERAALRVNHAVSG